MNRLFWKIFFISVSVCFLSSSMLSTDIGQLFFGLSTGSIIISLFYKIIWEF